MLYEIPVGKTLIVREDKVWVSIRDYVVKEHISKKKTLRVVYGDFYMDIPPAKLKKYRQFTPQAIQSKVYPTQSYHLYDYPWVNPKSVKEEELKLKTRLERGY